MNPVTTAHARPDSPRRILSGLAVILFFSACAPKTASAQVLPCEDCTRRRPVAAVAGIVSANLATWGYDRFVAQAWWARVGPDTWGDNLNNGMVWDDNPLPCNQIMHPLHGSMYFNATRGNGYGYWGSMAGAALGSSLWEFLGETHPPAPNDLVSTTIGGAALGETMHRLSRAIHARGRRAGPAGRLVAGLLDPMGRTMDRIGGGGAGEADLPERIMVSVDVGFDRTLGGGSGTAPRYRPVLDIGVRYGDLLTDDVRRPFDVFEFRIRLGRGIQSGRGYGPENPVDRLESRGALVAASIIPGRFSIGLYQHIDFSRSSASEFGAQSLTASLGFRRPISSALQWRGEVHLGGMLLASSPSRLVNEPERVNDYGPGLLAKVDTRLSGRRTDFLRIEGRIYWMQDVSRNHTKHLVTLLAGEARLPLGGGFSAASALEVSTHASFADLRLAPPSLSASMRFTVTWTPGR